MPFNPEMILAAVACVCGLVLFVLCVKLYMTFLTTWLQAFTSGTPVVLLDLIGMRMRGTDFKTVVRALIMARQGGVAISPAEMERAWVQGVNLEKVTLAVIQATKNNMDITFEELVDADLDDRLARLLEERRHAPLEEPAYR